MKKALLLLVLLSGVCWGYKILTSTDIVNIENSD